MKSLITFIIAVSISAMVAVFAIYDENKPDDVVVTEPNEPACDFHIASTPKSKSLFVQILESIPTWPEYYEVEENINIILDHPDTEDFIDMEISVEKGTKIYAGRNEEISQ